MTKLVDSFEVVSDSTSLSATSHSSLTVNAPTGKKFVGGGYAIDSVSENLYVLENGPSSDLSEWTVTVSNPNGTAHDMTVSAVAVG